MATTSKGLRYPLSSDHKRLWEHFQALALDVDALLSSGPRCKISATAAQTMSVSGTTYVMDFASSTVDYDTDGMADTANDQIVIRTAGWYRLTAFAVFTANTTGARDLFIDAGPGGSGHRVQVFAAPTPTGSCTLHCQSEPVSLAVNDLVQAKLTQVSGGSLTTTSVNSQFSYLAAHWAFAS